MPCTIEKWNELIDSPIVVNTCMQIRRLDTTAADYNDRKNALKRRLPIIMPHAAQFLHGRRVSADAVPSGFAMLDVDHVAEPRKWFESLSRETIIANHIYLIAITASGQGLRIIGARLTGESIEDAQMRMADALGIKEYDAVTKDLARASYVVPRDYILWMDSEELLGAEPREFESSKVQEFESAKVQEFKDAQTLPLRQGHLESSGLQWLRKGGEATPKGEGVDVPECNTTTPASVLSTPPSLRATSPVSGEESEGSDSYHSLTASGPLPLSQGES